ncbi:porin [Paraburkholderia sp. BCC1886]|uniref:porin n=1 Tax=Paraburkholderia sp. BCC1886 TaxID=2562670 RepID=UPI00391F9B33
MKQNNPTRDMLVKTLLATAATAVALPASAQSSVTLYGVVDDALTYVSNQSGHANVYLRQGNLYASKFGIKGTEDLGGGLAAIFDLQAGFDTNTGAAASSGSLFNRQSYVGLSQRGYGAVTLGRQYTPYFQFVGPLSSVNLLTGATGAHPGDLDGMDTTIRANNAVVYTSPQWYGMQASVMYAAGGIAGSTGRGQSWSGALRYTRGPLALAAGYLQMDNAYTSTTSAAFDSTSTGGFGVSAVNRGYVSARSVRDVALAANYAFGAVLAGLSYSNVRYLPGARSLFTDTAAFNTYGAFARWSLTPAVDIAAGYSYTLASKANGVDSAARYQQVSVRQSYRLSKRTSLYALEAWQHAGGQTLDASGGVIDAAPVVGDSQNLTPSSTRSQFVGMLGMAVSF